MRIMKNLYKKIIPLKIRENISMFGSAWKQTFADFFDYKLLRMSAALAYYAIFALVPMLVIIISIATIMTVDKPIGTIYLHMRSFVGDGAAKQIETMLTSALNSKNSGLAQIASIIALIFSATGVFTEIQDSINVIWRLKAKPKKGWLKLLINRLLSFSIVISLGFILLVSLILNAVLDSISEQLYRVLPQIEVYNAYMLNLLLTFVTTGLLFGIIFKVLPDAKIMWRDVFNGAIITSLMFMLGKFGISYYLQKSPVASTYGAAGSIVVILLFVYYSAIILYLGAAFTRAYAKIKGREIYPNKYAVWVERVEKNYAVQPDVPLTETNT